MKKFAILDLIILAVWLSVGSANAQQTVTQEQCQQASHAVAAPRGKEAFACSFHGAVHSMLQELCR